LVALVVSTDWQPDFQAKEFQREQAEDEEDDVNSTQVRNKNRASTVINSDISDIQNSLIRTNHEKFVFHSRT
jgi:hypothetical protein